MNFALFAAVLAFSALAFGTTATYAANGPSSAGRAIESIGLESRRCTGSKRCARTCSSGFAVGGSCQAVRSGSGVDLIRDRTYEDGHVCATETAATIDVQATCVTLK